MTTSTSPALPRVVVLMLGVLAVSTASIFIRFAQAEVTSLAIAAWRMGLAALILIPFVFARRRNELGRWTRSDVILACLSGAFLAVHFATWISSLAYTTVASSVLLVDTAPLWVGLLAPLVLGERLGRPLKVGLWLAFAGVVVVGASDACTWEAARPACPSAGDLFSGQAFWGDFLALIGAFAAAGYLVIGRRVRAHTSLLSYISVVYGVAAVILIGLALAAAQPLAGYSPGAYGWLLALAVIPQLLGHSSYNWALGYLPAAFVSIALLGEPIGSTLLASIFLGEIPSGIKISGAILILAGIYTASRKPTPD